jgi:hypothetical protein
MTGEIRMPNQSARHGNNIDIHDRLLAKPLPKTLNKPPIEPTPEEVYDYNLHNAQ